MAVWPPFFFLLMRRTHQIYLICLRHDNAPSSEECVSLCVSNVARVKLCALFSLNQVDKAIVLGQHVLFLKESSARGGNEAPATTT